jgi:hypothetical protein
LPLDSAETPEWSRYHEDVERWLMDNQGPAVRSSTRSKWQAKKSAPAARNFLEVLADQHQTTSPDQHYCAFLL